MNTLFTVLAILVVLASVLVTIVVLLQNGKGGGLASNFVAGNQTFGVRQTADILEKITWGLAAFILLFAIVSNFTQNGSSKNALDVTDDITMEQSQQAPEFPVAPIQQDPAAEN